MKSKNNPPTGSTPISTSTFFHDCAIIVPILILSSGIASAVDLLKWDITNTSAASTSATAPVAGSGVASQASLGVSGSMVYANGGANGNATSPTNTFNRNFSYQANFTDAMAAGNYFNFTTTADAGYTVSISGITGLNMSRTSTGATSAGLFYSTNGVDFTPTGSAHTVTSTLSSAGSAFDDDMAVTPIVMNGGETIYWRVVVAGALIPETSTGGRSGIGRADIDDIVFTGTSVPDVAVHNLLWTGSGGSDWNTTPSNTNWADTGNANAPAPFITNDNVTINTTATLDVDAGGVSPGNVIVSGTTGTISLSGGSINGLTLTKSGGTTLSIDGTNSFSGGVSLTGGILIPVSATALGTSPIAIDGATLNTPATVLTFSNNLSLGTSGSTINTDANVTFSGAFSTTGAAVEASNQLTKTGTGVLTLTKTGSTAFGSQSNVGATGTSIELDITAGGVIFSGSGSRFLGGTCTWDTPVTLAGGSLMLHGATIEGTGGISVTSGSTIISRFNRGNCNVDSAITIDSATELAVDAPTGSSELSFNGIIGGSGNLRKIGNGVVNLTADNSYTGTTTVDSGSLRVGSGTTGTLGAGDVILNGTGGLEFRQDDTLGVANGFSGVGTVRMIGAAAAVTRLTGTVSHTGVTAVDEGALLIDGDASLATGTITVTAGGALGGNGTSGASAILAANGGLAASISDWTGVAGTGYDDLAVASLDAGGNDINVTIDTTGLVNFDGSAKSFTIVNTTGGVMNLTGTVTVNATGFPGTGTWALAESSGSLVLSYAAATDYDNWAASFSLVEGPTGDDDNDGLSNEKEYAFGLIPNSGASVNPITVQLDKTAGTFIYQRRNPALGTGLTYSVWTSPDLITWTEDTSAVLAPVDNGDNQSVAVTLTGIKPLAAPKLFVRVTAD